MPFYWISSIFAAGIYSSSVDWIPSSLWSPALITSIPVCLLLYWWAAKQSTPNPNHWVNFLFYKIPYTKLPIAFLVPVFLLGGWVYQGNLLPNNGMNIYSYNDQAEQLYIRGKIIEQPDNREKVTLLTVQAAQFQTSNGKEFATLENILLFIAPGAEYKYGDTVFISGVVSTPTETADFSYRTYLTGKDVFSLLRYPKIQLQARQIHPNLKSILISIRENSMALIAKTFPMPESTLAQGILLGDDQNIPSELQDSFRESGTSHIIAISGFNIAIVAGLVVILFSRIFGRWYGAILAIIAITLYTILVGASPSVVRAAIMGSLALVGGLLGRRKAGLNALFLTAGIMLAFNPFLLYSISFQLSVTATLGLVLFTDPIQSFAQQLITKWTDKNNAGLVAGWVSEYILFTLAAQLTTLPVLLYHFHAMPLVSILANALALPAQPPLMITAAISLFISWISPAIGQLAAWIAMPFLTYTIRIVNWAASLGWVYISAVQVNPFLSVGYYALLTLPFALPAIKPFKAFQIRPIIWIGASAAAAYLLLHTAIDGPDGHAHIYIGRSDTADIILVQAPAGSRVLIQGADSLNQTIHFLDERLPFSRRKLDASFMVGKDGAQALQSVSKVIPVDRIFSIENVNEVSTPYSGLTVDAITPGSIVVVDDSLSIKPTISKEGSAKYLLQIESFSMLIDPQTAVDEDLCGVNVVYANNLPSVLPRCTPQIILSNSTAKNIYPGINLMEYDWVHISTDGQRIWLVGNKD